MGSTFSLFCSLLGIVCMTRKAHIISSIDPLIWRFILKFEMCVFLFYPVIERVTHEYFKFGRYPVIERVLLYSFLC